MTYEGVPDRIICRAAQSGDPVAVEIFKSWPERKQVSVWRKVDANQSEWCISAFDGEVKREFRCPQDSVPGDFYCAEHAADFEVEGEQ